MKKVLYIFILIATFSSCSEYQKALKSEDISEKFKLGEQLFNEGKYSKANRLFAQIVPQYRGKPQAQKLMYMYAKSFYETKDYTLAGYQFERFEQSYPNSEKVQEASFLGAKSYYKLSPVYSKDQEDTVEALDKLQAFINKHPESEYLDEANELVNELDFKLQKKAFEIGKQFNQIARIASDHEACIKSMENFLVDFPGTSLREEALYWRLNSAYKLAINSTEFKKEDRMERAKTFLNDFKTKFPESSYLNDIESMEKELQ